MTIFEYADVANLNIEIIRYHNQDGRYRAAFEDCDLKDGNFLQSVSGNGKSANDALEDYINRIMGKTIIYMASSDKYRHEFIVPDYLTV